MSSQKIISISVSDNTIESISVDELSYASLAFRPNSKKRVLTKVGKDSDEIVKVSPSETTFQEQNINLPDPHYFHYQGITVKVIPGYLFISYRHGIFLLQSEDGSKRRLFGMDLEDLMRGRFLTPEDHLVDDFYAVSASFFTYVSGGKLYGWFQGKIYPLASPEILTIVKSYGVIRAMFSGNNFTELLDDARIRYHCLEFIVPHYGLSSEGSLYQMDFIGNLRVLAENVTKVIPRGLEDFYLIFKDGKVSTLESPDIFFPFELVLGGDILVTSNPHFTTILTSPVVSEIYPEKYTQLVESGHLYTLVTCNKRYPLPQVRKRKPKNNVVDPGIPRLNLEALWINQEQETLPIPPDYDFDDIISTIEDKTPLSRIKGFSIIGDKRKILQVLI
jgi:hypothetical protein